MNLKAASFIKKLSYAISTNMITLLISALTILVLPKILGIEDYGLLQLYIFYCAYVGFLHFGFNDGIYLRFAGISYEDMDKKIFFSQFVILFFSQLVFGICLWIGSDFLVTNNDKKFIWGMVSISLVIVNIRIMLMYIIQATNKIKEYAITIFYDRFSFLFLTSVYLLLGHTSYKLIVIFDLFGKLISLLYIMSKCKDIIRNDFSVKSEIIIEIKKNISSGIKLMIANFSNILIVGNLRFGIEKTWSVSTFGKISLALSISNLLMVFINSIGIVIFPLLRRTNIIKLPKLFQIIKFTLSTILLISLLLYYFLYHLLIIWLPEYKESFVYMAILFPMIIFEGKTALLLNTFLKTLRKESVILKVNLIVVSLSILLTLIFTVIFKSLTLSIYSITFLLALRCIFLDVYLSKILNVTYKSYIISEVILIVIFILTNQIFHIDLSFTIYSLCLTIYLLLNKKVLSDSYLNLLSMIKK